MLADLYDSPTSVTRRLTALNWEFGWMILEQQKGHTRGKVMAERLAAELQEEFSEMQGFLAFNLLYMISIYLAYPIFDTVHKELSFTHYRLQLKEKRMEVRQFYMDEFIAVGWSTRQLEQQIRSFFGYNSLSGDNEKDI